MEEPQPKGDAAMPVTALSECHVDVGAAGGVGELAAVLARDGVALFDGVRTEQQLLQLAVRLGRLIPHRDSTGSGLTVTTDRGNTRPPAGQAGFSRHALAPHSDCSDQPRPPLLVAMTCARPAGRGGARWPPLPAGPARPRPPLLAPMPCPRPAESGGDCVLVDGRAVHDELATSAPEALADLSARRGAYFGGAAGIVGNVFEPDPRG